METQTARNQIWLDVWFLVQVGSVVVIFSVAKSPKFLTSSYAVFLCIRKEIEAFLHGFGVGLAPIQSFF